MNLFNPASGCQNTINVMLFHNVHKHQAVTLT